METQPPVPALPVAEVIGYASTSPGGTRPIVLRRLAVLNWAMGVLLVIQIPGTFAGVILALQHANQNNGQPPSTVATFWDALRPQLPGMAPAIVFTVGCGTAAMVTAWLIGRRRGRWFGIIAGLLMCFAFPFGTVAGLPTAMILMRKQTRTAYAARTGVGLT